MPKLIRFIFYIRKLLKNKSYKNVYAMDETPVYFDNLRNSTLAKKGSKEVRIKTTGNDKKMPTCVLTASNIGVKKTVMIVFKGKRKTKEDLELKKRQDIHVNFSDNGWMNTDLTVKYVEENFDNDEEELFVWDSFKCHTQPEEVREKLNEKKVHIAVIPGGFTRAIQAPDVVWNGPFKNNLNAEYDCWLNNAQLHSFTKGGNQRAPTKTQLCYMVVRAWDKITKEMLIKSFRVCGQVRDVNIDEISAFKEGRCAESGKEKLKILWGMDANNIDYELLKKLLHMWLSMLWSREWNLEQIKMIVTMMMTWMMIHSSCSNSSKESHKDSYSSKNVFSCEQCAKASYWLSYLKKHTRTHTQKTFFM